MLRLDSPSLVGNNRAFHTMLRDGIEAEYRSNDGTRAVLQQAELLCADWAA